MGEVLALKRIQPRRNVGGSGLREHNERKLTAWLDKDDPGRSSGRYNHEEPVEARKLEGRVILMAGAYERADHKNDWHRKAKRLVEKGEKPSPYEDTDKVLLYLFGEWLWEVDYLAASAISQFIRTESVAGGMVELERLELAAKGGHDLSSVIAPLARRGVNKVLKKLEEEGFRLEVADDLRYKNKYQQRDHGRRITADGSKRILYGQFLALLEEGWTKEKAKEMVADHNDVSVSKIEKAITFCRRANEEEFPLRP